MSENNSNRELTPLVLIVDDDRTMRSLLNLAMEEEGYRVAEANNGEQCLSEYAYLQPNLILLDAVMPNLDGFTCCQKIRNLPGGDSLPILMITVLDDGESVEQAFQAGATDYITKPIHWAVLSQRVRRLLSIGRVDSQMKAIQAQLARQQAWEELIAEILQLLSQNNFSGDSMAKILTLIRDWSAASRVLLYLVDTENYLESVTVGFPSIDEFSGLDFNLLGEYGEQYHQGKTVVIEDIAKTNLPPVLVDGLKQLKSQRLSVIPLYDGTRLLGLLAIHSNFPQWQESMIERFSDLGKLLTIKLESNIEVV
ncbi:MAG: response regulator [Pleurocapsa sp.]